MSFRENLVSKMEESKITNYRLSKDIHVHATTIRNWKEGINPILEHIKRVADYFGTTIDEMTK